MVIFMHGKETLNMETYTDPIVLENEVSNYVRANVTAIIAGLSRYYWFHQTIYQYERWPDATMETKPIEKTNWIDWIDAEKRHS